MASAFVLSSRGEDEDDLKVIGHLGLPRVNEVIDGIVKNAEAGIALVWFLSSDYYGKGRRRFPQRTLRVVQYKRLKDRLDEAWVFEGELQNQRLPWTE